MAYSKQCESNICVYVRVDWHSFANGDNQTSHICRYLPICVYMSMSVTSCISVSMMSISTADVTVYNRHCHSFISKNNQNVWWANIYLSLLNGSIYIYCLFDLSIPVERVYLYMLSVWFVYPSRSYLVRSLSSRPFICLQLIHLFTHAAHNKTTT